MLEAPEFRPNQAQVIAAKIRSGSHVVWASISLIFVVTRLDGGGSVFYWLWAVTALLVPFVIHFFSRNSPHPFPTIHRELLVAALLQGVAVALLEFRPLPTLAVAAPIAGFVLGGGLKLLGAGSLGFLVGALLGGLVLGYSIETEVGSATKIVSAILVLANQVNLAFVALSSQDSLGAVYKNLEDKKFTDALTGLKNRHFIPIAIEDRCEKSIRFHEAHGVLGRQDLVICLLRVARLQSGDRILLETAHRLLEHLTETDLLVRWDESSFLIISDSEDRERSSLIADRILRLVLEPIDIGGGRTTVVTASIGMAAFPFMPSQPRLLDWKDTVHLAEQAELHAAQTGPNRRIQADFGDQRWDGDMVQRLRSESGFPELVTSGAIKLIG